MITISGEALEFYLELKRKHIQATGEREIPDADFWWYCPSHKGFHPGKNGKPQTCDLNDHIDNLVRGVV